MSKVFMADIVTAMRAHGYFFKIFFCELFSSRDRKTAVPKGL
jgi:hypothetical protein